MIDKNLKKKLEYYEQVYFGLDRPIPFKNGITLHPIPVNQYYDFYSCLPCITEDKNVKETIDENGRKVKTANIEGIQRSYLGYLIFKIQNNEDNGYTFNQLTNLLELVTHIKRGFYCPKCGKEHSYDEIINKMNKYVTEVQDDANKMFQESLQEIENQTENEEEKKKRNNEKQQILNIIAGKARLNYLNSLNLCEDCNVLLQEVYSIDESSQIKKLRIKDVIISPKEFDEIKAIIPRQNIFNYNDDEYMDPDLKEELEIKARLQNSDYTSPTLEKSIICVAIGTGYTIQYIKTLPMRKLSYFLKVIDSKNTYYAQLQASMSGMVKFKEDPKHWIFSDDKKNIKDELTDSETFERKFEHVT